MKRHTIREPFFVRIDAYVDRILRDRSTLLTWYAINTGLALLALVFFFSCISFATESYRTQREERVYTVSDHGDDLIARGALADARDAGRALSSFTSSLAVASSQRSTMVG